MQEEKIAGEYVEPQPRKVAAFCAAALVALLLGAVCVFGLLPQVIAWSVDTSQELAVRNLRQALVLATVLVLMVVVTLGCSAWWWVMALRCRRSGRFPPAGYPVLRRVRVQTGEQALRSARLMQACGFACLLLGMAAVGLVCVMLRVEQMLAPLWAARACCGDAVETVVRAGRPLLFSMLA